MYVCGGRIALSPLSDWKIVCPERSFALTLQIELYSRGRKFLLQVVSIIYTQVDKLFVNLSLRGWNQAIIGEHLIGSSIN